MYTRKDYDRAVNEQINFCTDTLLRKRDEYATEDVFHNFNVAAEILGVTPIEALGGMMVKHTTSIYDMITSNSGYTREMWREKITDHINYLLILAAMIDADVKKYETIGVVEMQDEF